MDATAGSIGGSSSAAVTWGPGSGATARKGGVCIERPGCKEQLFLCSWSAAVVRRASDSAPACYLHRPTSLALPQRFLRLPSRFTAAFTIITCCTPQRSREVKPRGKLFFSVADASTFSVHIPLKPVYSY